MTYLFAWFIIFIFVKRCYVVAQCPPGAACLIGGVDIDSDPADPPTETPNFDTDPLAGLNAISVGPFEYATDSCMQGSVIDTSSATQAPYTVSLQLTHNGDSNYKVHTCGGIMIAKRILLTAAHCFWDIDYDIRESGQNEGTPRVSMWGAIAPLCRHQQGQGQFKVERYYLHPDWSGNVYRGYDIAVVLLEESSSLFNGPFANYKSADTFTGSQELTLLGWGYVNSFEAGNSNLYRTTVRQLQKVNLKYVSDTVCESEIENQIASDQFCATFITANANNDLGDSCAGDSGGPLLMGYQGKGEIPIGVGIVSWGPDLKCSGDGLPGVYTKIWEYERWIGTTIEDIEEGLNPSDPTPTQTSTPTPTQASTPTPTQVSTPTPTQASTPTPTQVSTPTPTQTFTPTQNPTSTFTPSSLDDCPSFRCIGSAQSCCNLGTSSVCSAFGGLRQYTYAGTCEGGRDVWQPERGSSCYC